LVLLRLLLLFAIVLCIELALLVWIGRHTGWLVVLALIFVPGLAGASLARRQGLRCWQTVEKQLAAGQLPAAALVEGLMVLVAGVLLIVPGVLTDLIGLALLIPPIRHAARRGLAGRLQARVVSFTQSQMGPSQNEEEEDAQIIDVEYRRPGDFDA
jgi:UPF0716 protein FxsA